MAIGDGASLGGKALPALKAGGGGAVGKLKGLTQAGARGLGGLDRPASMAQDGSMTARGGQQGQGGGGPRETLGRPSVALGMRGELDSPGSEDSQEPTAHWKRT